MPRDERLINPGNYIQKASQHFKKNRRDLMNYADAFAIKGGVGEPPFNTSRLGPRDLNNRMRAKKFGDDRRKNFTGDNPQAMEVFDGLGPSFGETRNQSYNFDAGRPNIPDSFVNSPDFAAKGENWVESYRISPTAPKKVSNPMPRTANPDPKGILMKGAEKKAENEVEGNMNVAQLLKSSPEEIKEAEEKG